jgi:ankyrin repeat protein
MDGPSMIDVPYKRVGGVTPIFEAVRRDNITLFNFLLGKGARLDIKIDSPGMRDRFDWCILHTAAHHSPEDDQLELAMKILDTGVPPHGYVTEGQEPTETPLAVAIEHNNFKLASLLPERGANVDALSRYTLCSSLKLDHPMTILSRIITTSRA